MNEKEVKRLQKAMKQIYDAATTLVSLGYVSDDAELCEKAKTWQTSLIEIESQIEDVLSAEGEDLSFKL